MIPPLTALLPLVERTPARAETAPVGAVTESFEAAGAADAMVGTATSDRAIMADVAILETLINTTPFKSPNLNRANATIFVVAQPP